MKFRFVEGKLQVLYTDPRSGAGYAAGIVTIFRKRVQTIGAAPDERTFYGLRSLRFERLKGNRSHQYSMRLNDQWRLILELEGKGPDKIVAIVAIEDYH